MGNKNYSSWSLRPWLLLSFHGIPFHEVRVPLGLSSTRAAIIQYSGAGKLPVLLDDDLTIWDSLAICEYVSEKYLEGQGWPEDAQMRAEARSCSAEMHSGFVHLREYLPMNCRALGREVAFSPHLAQDICRVTELWGSLREKYGHLGPWLFGRFSIADCMFAPVASRFLTYGVATEGHCSTYMQYFLANEHMRAWLKDAQQESETIPANEAGA